MIMSQLLGGVDYQRASFRNTTTSQSQVESLIPLVTKRIGAVIEDLIEFGAVNFVVPGDFPKGWFPSYLTKFQSLNQSDYDPTTGCLVYHNWFSARHNKLLKKEIERIRKVHRHISVRYADYFSTGIRMHRNPEKYGIVKATMNKACCGAGGPYNYNPAAVCGRVGAVACGNPKAYIIIKWDDHHYTEAANRVIAGTMFKRRFQYRTACKNLFLLPHFPEEAALESSSLRTHASTILLVIGCCSYTFFHPTTIESNRGDRLSLEGTNLRGIPAAGDDDDHEEE
ncbi:unnamed protein product [Linum tenue]|uniref:Uncharacterized protein n=1 Tax=Linum tenue TaxID=586396 RepID=A0AAV0I855_9ROSI|nr:unnamed protein product [Linum tenue]